MSKQPNIRWRKADKEKLFRAVRNQQAKLNRIEKQLDLASMDMLQAPPELRSKIEAARNDVRELGMERWLLPERATMKDLTAKIKTRADFNREIKRLKNFTARGGEFVRFDMRPGESAELESTVRQFNAKIDKLSKADPKIATALPEKLTVNRVKNMLGSREAYRDEVKALRRFLQDGAEELVPIPGKNEYNTKITKWQKEEIDRRLPAINEERAKRRERIAEVEVTDRGEKTGYKKGQIGMGKAEDHALSPMEAYTDSMSQRDAQRKFRLIMRESQGDYWDRRDAIMRENYIRGLMQNFPKKEVEEIVREIRSMGFDEFRKIFEAEEGKFEDLYPGQRTEEYISRLKSIWIPNK